MNKGFLGVVSLLQIDSSYFKEIHTETEDAGVRFLSKGVNCFIFQEITMSQITAKLRSPHMRKDTVY